MTEPTGHSCSTLSQVTKAAHPRREGIYISTFLYILELDSDSNDVERMNRRFVSKRSDGGGSRSGSGMCASSILFTVFAIYKLNGTRFYDVLCNSADGG